MKKLLIVFVLAALFGSGVVRAQEATPQVQALTGRLISEINGSLSCSTALIEAQAKIKALEAKLAPKEEPQK